MRNLQNLILFVTIIAINMFIIAGHISAQEVTSQTYTLTVKPEPADARVRIMNIQPRYHDGIALALGRYDIEVSQEGYYTYREWLTLSEDTILPVSLEEINEEALRKRALKAAADKTPLYTFNNNSRDINRVQFSQSGWYALGAGYNVIRLWDLRTGSNFRSLFGHNGTVQCASFSPDEQYVVSGGYDNTIRLWSVNSGDLIRILGHHESYVESVAFSPDGKYLASGGLDNLIKLWDMFSHSLIRTFEGHADWILSVRFSHDGKYIISGSEDQSIKLWDVHTGALLKSFYGFRSSAEGAGELIDISPDGKTVIGASTDNTFALWSVETEDIIGRFYGHEASVTSVKFSPNGQYVASSGMDKVVKVWSLDGRELVTFVGHESGSVCNWVNSVDFSPDGRYIISGGCDDTLKIWVFQE
jgi:WD40 repeat protein